MKKDESRSEPKPQGVAGARKGTRIQDRFRLPTDEQVVARNFVQGRNVHHEKPQPALHAPPLPVANVVWKIEKLSWAGKESS
jgi:hypothetical protein